MSTSTTSLRTPSRQGGFTLIEILVSMVLVSIALLGLAPVTLRVAQMSSQFTTTSQRTALLTGMVSRIETQPFDALTAGTTCQTDTYASLPHSSCTTVTDLSEKTKQITVIVTPLDGTAADTTVIERSKGASVNPLDTQ